MIKESKLLESALAYAERGWPVLPVHWPAGKECSCGKSACSSVAKHPLTVHGLVDASADRNIIREWWRSYPQANVGLRTGRSSALLVLDIDVRHNGEKSLTSLEDKLGPLPEGPCVKTGGGQHRYFSYPGVEVSSRAGIDGVPGCDVRAKKGYVVAPPSLHKSGRKYRWLNEPPEDGVLPQLPKKWLNFLVSAPSHHAHKNVAGEGQRKSAIASSVKELFRQGRNSRPTVRVLQRLENVVELSSAWTARCPSHADSVNSLSVSEGADGRALIYCHAGCEFEQIVKALGLRVRDLFVQHKGLTWR